METGVHDVLVIRCAAGEVLVPFVDQYIDSVDLDERRVVVDWDKSWA